MSETAATWLERIALLMQFVSFFFVAPEIMGEERLRRWEAALEKWLKLANKAFDKGDSALIRLYNNYRKVVVLPMICLCLTASILHRISDIDIRNETFHLLGYTCGTPITAMLLLAIVVRLTSGRIDRLLASLADDSRLRRRYLIYGAWLFAVATLLQFVATF